MNKANKIFNLLLPTLILIGAIIMTTSNFLPAYIAPSQQFHGHFDVVTFVKSRGIDGLYQAFTQKRIPCANIATARTVKREINDGTYNETPKQLPVSVERSLLTPEQLGGCLTGGYGYEPAVTWVATGRVERVSNWATARQLKRNYPTAS